MTLEGFFYISWLHLDYLGCQDCENFDADLHTDEAICEEKSMKEGCKKLLAMLEKV